jgi:hypothetical protein
MPDVMYCGILGYAGVHLPEIRKTVSAILVSVNRFAAGGYEQHTDIRGLRKV